MDAGFQRFSTRLWSESLAIQYLRQELPNQCSSFTFQFADDTTLAEADPTSSAVADNLTSYHAIKELCDSHDLKINPEKTQLTIFKKPTKSIPEDFHLTLDNCTIKPQNTVKLLGVTLDYHLTFGPHYIPAGKLVMTS